MSNIIIQTNELVFNNCFIDFHYRCSDCPKGFSLQSMLHVHILAKHTKAKPYICEECGKSFVTKPGLKIHLKKHKTETKEEYPCVECGKV